MSKQRYTDDGLPVLEAPVTDASTDDGLPILKKKSDSESTVEDAGQDLSNGTGQISPSKSESQFPVIDGVKQFIERRRQLSEEGTSSIGLLDVTIEDAPLIAKAQDYEEYQSRLSAADKELSKVSGGGTFDKFDKTLPSYQQDQAIKKEKIALANKNRDAIKIGADAAQSLIAKDVEMIGNEALWGGKNNFTTTDSQGFTIPNKEKISEFAKKKAKEAGVSEDGYFKTLIYNEAVAKVEHKIIEPAIEKNLDEKFKSKYGESVKDYFSKQEADALAKQQEITTKTDLQLKSLQSEMSGSAEAEASPLRAGFEEQATKVNSEYSAQSAALMARGDEINNYFQAGQITKEQADAEIQNLNEELKGLGNNYLENFKVFEKTYLDELNKVNNKYNLQFERQQNEIVRIANTQLSKEMEKFKGTKEFDSDIKKMYADAYKETINSRQGARDAFDNISAGDNPAILWGRSFLSTLGNSIGGISTALGYSDGAVMGDRMAAYYQVGGSSLEKASDLLDVPKMIKSTASLAGGMTPMLLAAVGTTVATGGAGAGVGVQMLAGGLAGWASETMDIAGRMYKDKFAETGSAATASKAANQTIESQAWLMPTYALEMLPFVKGGLKMIKGMAGRATAGAAIEYGTELTQEFPQNIFEQNIREGREFNDIKTLTKNYTDYSALTKQLKETALNLIPMVGLGAFGQISQNDKSPEKVAEDWAKSQYFKTAFAKHTPYQQGQQISNIAIDRGQVFAEALADAMYANGTINQDTHIELKESAKKAQELVNSVGTLGLGVDDAKAYGAFLDKANGLRKQAEEVQDEGVKKMLLTRAADMDAQSQQILDRQDAEYVTVEYPDGSKSVWSHDELKNATENPEFIAASANGGLKVTVYNGDKEVLEALKQKSEQYLSSSSETKQKANIPTEETKSDKPQENLPTGDKTITDNKEYRGQHQIKEPPFTADKITKAGGHEDFFDNPSVNYDLSLPTYKESYRVLKQIRDNPDAEVTVYRAVPSGVDKINSGDWISLSKTYAKEHGMDSENASKDMPVISMKVKAKDIGWDGNDINEFSYNPKESQPLPPKTGESDVSHTETKVNIEKRRQEELNKVDRQSKIPLKDERPSQIVKEQRKAVNDFLEWRKRGEDINDTESVKGFTALPEAWQTKLWEGKTEEVLKSIGETYEEQINAKYDAEVNALESKTPTPPSAPTNKLVEKQAGENTFAINFIDSGFLNSVGDKYAEKMDLGMPTKDVHKAIKDIREGKDSAPARKLLEKIKAIEESGVVPMMQGVGGITKRWNAPLKEMEKISEELTPEELKTADHYSENLSQMINEQGITLENIEQFKDHFFGDNSFPFSKGDYEAVKTFLEHEAETKRQTESISETKTGSTESAELPKVTDTESAIKGAEQLVGEKADKSKADRSEISKAIPSTPVSLSRTEQTGRVSKKGKVAERAEQIALRPDLPVRKELEVALETLVNEPTPKNYDAYYNAFVKAYESPFRGSEDVKLLWDKIADTFPDAGIKKTGVDLTIKERQENQSRSEVNRIEDEKREVETKKDFDLISKQEAEAKLAELKTKLQEAKDKRKAVVDAQKNLGVTKDPFKNAKDKAEVDRKVLDAYIDLGLFHLKQGVKSVQEFAKALGEEVNDIMKYAWDSLHGDIKNFRKWVDYGVKEFKKEDGKLDFNTFRERFIEKFKASEETKNQDLNEIFTQASREWNDKARTDYKETIKQKTEGKGQGFEFRQFVRELGIQEKFSKLGAKEQKATQEALMQGVKLWMNDQVKRGTLTVKQATSIIKKVTDVNSIAKLDKALGYAEKVFANAEYAEQMNDVRKLQSTAGKRKHPVMDKAVKDFLNINPENIPDELMPKYIQALDELGGKVPSYKAMQKIYYDIEALKIKPDEYSNIKTFEQAAEKYSEIALNEVKSIEDYRKLFKDINGFKRKVNELYERGDITEQQHTDLLEQVGKDQKAVESKYASEITSLKTDLINELHDRTKSVGLANMTAENKRLLDRFFDLDNNDLRNLSPEELYNLHSIFDNIIEDGYVDVFRLNPIIAKAEAITESKKIVQQIDKAKPFTQSVKEAVAKLGTLTSSFWEGSLGLGKVAYGEFHKNIISPMQRAAGDYINLVNKGQTNFVKLKNKYGIKSDQMNKIGMVAMYLREYGLKHNPEYKGTKDKLGNELGSRDWFKHVLESDYEKSKLSNGELDAIQSAWDSFNRKNGVNPEDVYNSFINGTNEFLSPKEMNFLKEAMEWKDANMTGKQRYANELRGKPFDELLFHTKRIRKDGKKAQEDVFQMTESGNVKIAAGSGKEVLSEEMGVIETNFEKIFTETLEENARDYFFTPMLQKVNAVIRNTKDALPENKKAYMDAASQNLQAALNHEFTPSRVNSLVRNLMKAKAAQILIAPIRTTVELFSSLLTYPARARAMNTYIELFKPRKAVRQLLEDTESPLRNRQNLNKYVELQEGKIKPKGFLEKATHYLSALPELLGLEPVWMATFKNEFKKETGKDFSESEYLNNPQYKHTYNKQIKDSGSLADATYEKIAGATTAAGQRRTIKVLPTGGINWVGEKLLPKNVAASLKIKLGEGLDAKTSLGSVMSFMTGYTSREIIQVYDSFSAFSQAMKDAEYSKGDVAKTLLPVAGSVLGVVAYNYGQQISYALQNMLFGDDDDKKEGKTDLEKLTTVKGVFTELVTGMTALAASKYSGMGRQLVNLVGSLYYNSADKPEDKAYAKSIVRNITYNNPFDTSKSRYLMKGQVSEGIVDAIVPLTTIMDNITRAVNEAGGAKYLYDKVRNGDLLTEPEKEAVLLMQVSVNAFNAFGMLFGKAIPNTFVNKIAKEYQAEIDKANEPTMLEKLQKKFENYDKKIDKKMKGIEERVKNKYE